jgi:hypothetical protein
MSSGEHGTNPVRELACPSLKPQHVGSSARDEQPPNILVATSADTKQRRLPTGTVLPGNETDRRCKIATAPILLAVTHFCGQNTGGDGADARDRQQAPAELVVCELGVNFFLNMANFAVEVLVVLVQTLKDRDQAWWQ